MGSTSAGTTLERGRETLRVRALGAGRAMLARELQKLRGVEGAPAGVALLDLMPAREAVGHHELRLPALREPPGAALARRMPARRRSALARSPTRRPCRSSRVSGASSVAPICSSSVCSGSTPPVAAAWQCPCSEHVLARGVAARSRRWRDEELGEVECLLSRAAARPRRAAASSSARRGTPRRSSARARRPARRPGSRPQDASSDALEVATGEVEEAVVVERAPAAEARRRGTTTRNPAASSTSTAAAPISDSKWFVNVSGQRITGRAACDRAGARSCEPGLKRRSARTAAAAAAGETPAAAFASAREPRRLREDVREPGRSGGEPRPAVDQPERVGVPRPQPAARSGARGTRPSASACRR